MVECGYSPIDFGDPRSVEEKKLSTHEEVYGPIALRMECMFDKGFHFKDGWGGMCSDPNYRPKLTVCQNIPQRSRNSFYGK